MSISMRSDENGVTDYKELKDSTPINQKIFISAHEAAILSGLAYHAVYELLSRPDVNFIYKQGRKNYIHREKFEAYLARLTEV